MTKPINLSHLAAALRQRQQLQAEADAQRQREDEFRAVMGLVGAAAAEGIHKGRRILRVLPTPHPSDEGLRPLRTNFPRANQRIMTHGSHMAVMR